MIYERADCRDVEVDEAKRNQERNAKIATKMQQERLSQQLRVSDVRRAKRDRIARLAGLEARHRGNCIGISEKAVAAELRKDYVIREKLRSLEEAATTSNH